MEAGHGLAPGELEGQSRASSQMIFKTKTPEPLQIPNRAYATSEFTYGPPGDYGGTTVQVGYPYGSDGQVDIQGAYPGPDETYGDMPEPY